MAQLNLDFDADDVPQSDYGLIPDGSYVAMITESDIRETKRGDGRYISLTIEIVDEKCNGRRVWDTLNIENPNPKAVDIAKIRLSKYCLAVGVNTPKDTEDLHDKLFLVKIGTKPDAEHGDKNVVKDVQPYGQQYADPEPSPAKAHAQPTNKPAPKAKKPWE